jgi:hypothetical protein
MQLLKILLCIALAFSPVVGFVIISDNKKWGKSFLLALSPFGVAILLLFAAMFVDFHSAAFILQILIPLILIAAVIGIVVWGFTLLYEKGFFKGKRLIGTLLVFAIMIMAIGCTAFYKLQSKGFFEKVDYSKYPDIEFSGTYYAKGGNKRVTVHWESSDNTFTNTSEKDIKYEPDEPRKMLDTVSGKEIDVSKIFYNADETAIYYSNYNRIFRYTPADNSYELIGTASAEDDSEYYINKICVSDDETKAYYIATDYIKQDAHNNLYCIDISTGKSSVIIHEDGWVRDFEISPDGKSIIYNGNNRIGQYDIASRTTTVLLEGTTADTRDNGGDKIIRISEDGRYIMYYVDTVPIMCSQIFVYDTQTGTTEKVIKTNKYSIHDVAWEK